MKNAKLLSLMMTMSILFVGTELLAGSEYEVQPNLVSCLLVRERASQNSNYTSCLSSGTRLTVLKSNPKGYSLVQIGSRKGYVWTKYIRKSRVAAKSAIKSAPAGVETKKPEVPVAHVSQKDAEVPTKSASNINTGDGHVAGTIVEGSSATPSISMTKENEKPVARVTTPLSPALSTVNKSSNTELAGGHAPASVAPAADLLAPLMSKAPVVDMEKVNASKSTCSNDLKRMKTLMDQPRAQSRDVTYDEFRSIVADSKYKIRENVLQQAFATYTKNKSKLVKQNAIALIDYNTNVSKERMFVIDLEHRKVTGYKTSHGKGSGNTSIPNENGFGNDPRGGTKKSSLGCSIVGGWTAFANHPDPKKPGKEDSIIMHGFESTNNNMCSRDVLMHEAWYTGSGQSWGCPTFASHAKKHEFFDAVGNGGLLCAYFGKDEPEKKLANEPAAQEKSQKKNGRRI